MNRGFAICPQPLSRLAATAPRPGSLLAFCNHHPKAVPVYGGFEPSAPGGRCSEGRIPRTRWRLLVRFTNLYINNNGDASRPLIFTIYYAHPPQGGSHIVQAIFHCALAQFHPFARTDFTAGVSPPPYLTLLAWTTKREPSSSSVQVVRVSTWSAWPMDMASDTLELGAVRA